jgi:hypothetical protein
MFCTVPRSTPTHALEPKASLNASTSLSWKNEGLEKIDHILLFQPSETNAMLKMSPRIANVN